MIKKIGITWTDIGITEVFVNFQRTGCHPLTILIITSVLSNFADIDFRIKVGSKCFMMISCITVYDIQILDFVEIMFGCIGCVDSTDSRIETTAKNGCQTCFLETVVVSPLPAVFKMSFIFRLIVGCIQVVDTRLQTGFHNGKVLIRKSNVDYDFRLKVIE